MTYSIQEIVTNLGTNNTNTMIPILIGKSKTNYQEQLNFIDSNKTNLKIINASNSLIDSSTISVSLKSWNLKCNQFSITNNTAGTTQFALSLSLSQKLPENSIFIIVDTNNNILFSSTIESYIYQQLNLIEIITTNSLELTGTFSCYFIALETNIIAGTFDNSSNILVIDTSLVFKSPSLNYIYNTSYITYVGSSSIYSINNITNITQENIDNEQNPDIKAGLILGQSAIIISYPNETYINNLLEDLDKFTIGYYIVPINVTSINMLISYIQKTSKFYFLFLWQDILISNVLVSNQTFTK